ncbi:MAG: hypothetical protein JWM97_3136 [Phycisphaerales bacterium]|nr:hypothetical protein [Phycisphaerales bacterium]
MALQEEGRRQLIDKLIDEHYEHARLHEAHRAATTNFLLAAAAGICALVAAPHFENSILPPLALIILGLLGTAFSHKHYAQFRLHIACAVWHRLELEYPRAPLPSLRQLREEGEQFFYDNPIKTSEKQLELQMLQTRAGLVSDPAIATELRRIQNAPPTKDRLAKSKEELRCCDEAKSTGELDPAGQLRCSGLRMDYYTKRSSLGAFYLATNLLVVVLGVGLFGFQIYRGCQPDQGSRATTATTQSRPVGDAPEALMEPSSSARRTPATRPADSR